MAKSEKAAAPSRLIRNHNVSLLLCMLLNKSLSMRSAALPKA